MGRALLDTALQELDAQVMQLGALVAHALAKALEALETRDQDVAGAVVVADTTIDDLHLAIDWSVSQTIVRISANVSSSLWKVRPRCIPLWKDSRTLIVLGHLKPGIEGRFQWMMTHVSHKP
jgi:hypothetical protein